MPRSAAISIENNFSKGLITEVTGVNSPENSVSETKNIVYDRKGRAFPRGGFQYETGYEQNAISTEGVRTEFIWETSAANGSKTFLAIQVGSTIRFFESTGAGGLSSGYKSFNVNLLTYRSGGFSQSQVRNTPASMTSGKGYLFIAHPYCETIYVRYNPNNDTITERTINIQIRDFEGVDDGLALDRRPTAYSAAHFYNLYNQGWYTRAQRYGTEDIDTIQVLNYWRERRSDYPSNADVWWYFTASNPQQGTKPDEAMGLEGFDPRLSDAKIGLYGSNTPAAKGHYIINALETNRGALTGVTVTENSSGGLRPSTVAFFTGRAFYAGINARDYSSSIYFSQIIENDNQLGRAYQANDPTSRESFDLLASDGGVIKIHDINTILDIRVIGPSLYVFASNGIWMIGGADSGPFKATDYVVTKVSSFPAISRSSIVDVGGTPVWWNYEGIFTLMKDQTGFGSEVSSLSETTIKSFYNDIPPASKLRAKGWFNDQSGLIYWLYRNTALGDETVFTNILVLDTTSGAFYPLDLPANKVISGVFAIRSVNEEFEQDAVVRNSLDPVISQTSDPVVVNISIGFLAREKEFKFVTQEGGNLTFSEITDGLYLDWGTDVFETYFQTGYRIRGDLMKDFQTNYLTVITEEINQGSCYVQCVWDYTNSNQSGRYSNPQQVYRTRQYRDYQRSKLKMRGNGYSLQFRFFGEAGRPFIIIGWAGFETANEAV